MTTTFDVPTVLGSWTDASGFERSAGGKAAQLHRLQTLGYPVPRWFCIPVGVFDRYASDPEQLASSEVPRELTSLVRDGLALTSLENADVAVRSSGMDEDSTELSYAGQFESYLYVRGEAAIADAVRRCWASAYTSRVAAYQGARTAEHRPPRLAVIVQAMVDPDSAGVAFSRDPIRPSDRACVVIESVWGHGEGLVSGELDADRFEVDRASGAIRARIACKERAVVRGERGDTQIVALDAEHARAASLSERETRVLASMVTRLESTLGAPQDVEWAVVGGKVWLLQARPMTAQPPDALFDASVNGGATVIWDNSNIVESYAGVTTPLTFSHVSRCYRAVYEQTCRLLGVPAATIAAHESMFRNMLGLIRGRVYYNLLNWYRLLALLSLGKRNASFMETMMGVRQTLPPDAAAQFDALGNAPRYSFWRRATIALSTAFRLVRADRLGAEFLARVDRMCGPIERADLSTRSIGELVALYHTLERELVQRWTAPIVNDIRCMMAFGVLKRLTERWVAPRVPSGAATAIYNDLLCGQGDLKSAEPTKLLMQIARRIDTGSAAFRARWIAESPDALWAALRHGAAPEIATLFDDFLRRYGFRCADELKLEEPDLHDDPRFAIAAVQTYVRLRSYDAAAMGERERSIRDTAEARVRSVLGGARRAVYTVAVRWARRAVSARETLRFERTRAFGVTRRLFRAIGQHLAALGAIAEPRDVFLLTIDEIVAYHEGRSLTTDFRPLVAIRQREFDEYRRSAAPPDRFVTRGAAAAAARFPALLLEHDLLAADAQSGDAEDASVLRGTPASPGVVEATVRVATCLDDAHGAAGEILVTERTDPGWVPVFPGYSGLIIERGSALSHSAIVARELGIPTVVGVGGRPTQRLRTGQRVRLDATRGEVHIL
jgi:phosphohistidine swiveling domain-containing protein